MSDKKNTRREFLKIASLGAAGLALAAPRRSNAEISTLESPRMPQEVSPNDRIRIATIGMGIIGFFDTRTALEVPGVELEAAADCYDSRLVHTKEEFGSQVDTTMDYREILDRSDVDAVILSVPDHWHATMSIEAMEAGKHVYCEKPMVQDVPDGARVIRTEQKTKKVFQVGSQFASSIIYAKAKELYNSGAIGNLNQVEARYNRNSSLGAWQYSIPPNVTEENIDWNRFLGGAPSRSFDPVRFFRWRNYSDYGTGIPGDLYVHLFTAIHTVLDSVGPNSIMTTGGLRFWEDGRDVPDMMFSMCGYSKSETHPEFTLVLQSNFADGSGGGTSFRFIGDQGVMEIDGDGITLTQSPRREPSLSQLVNGYNSVFTFSQDVQDEFAQHYRQTHKPEPKSGLATTSEYNAPEGYDDRFDHFVNFFDAVRNGTPVFEDATFGFRAAAPALLSNVSHNENRIVNWDPVAMEEMS